MPKNDRIDLAALHEAAEAAVVEIEELSPEAWIPEDGRRGLPKPWAELERAAEQAVEKLQSVAIVQVFPFVVVGVGTLNILEFHCPGGWRAHELVGLHAKALAAGDEELAQAVRSETVLQRVRRAAGPQVLDRVDPVERAADRFVRGIAQQLVEHAELSSAAVLLSETVPAMCSRVATATRRCEAEAETRSLSDLAEWFRTVRLGPRTVIGREQLSRAEIVERLESGDDPRFEELARHWYDHHEKGGGRRRYGPLYT